MHWALRPDKLLHECTSGNKGVYFEVNLLRINARYFIVTENVENVDEKKRENGNRMRMSGH